MTEGLRKGEYKILFVSPERFVTSSFVTLLQTVPQVCGLWFVVCGLWFVVCGLWIVNSGLKREVSV